MKPQFFEPSGEIFENLPDPESQASDISLIIPYNTTALYWDIGELTEKQANFSLETLFETHCFDTPSPLTVLLNLIMKIVKMPL